MLSEKKAIWVASGAALAVAAGLPVRGQQTGKRTRAAKVVATKVGTTTAGTATAGAAKMASGARTFAQMCVRCHGAQGEGTATYPHALTGSQTVGQLTAFIAESMPPSPKPCPRADAPKVAAYIYDAFYSSIAQARNRPARVALSRLTVRQMRNALCDLVGSFRADPPVVGTAHGLNAQYFKGRNFGDPVLERVDEDVRFDFGHDAPDTNAAFDPHQFSIRWTGSVVAPDTGEYTFTVRSDRAIRLWVNDRKTPIVDAFVASSNDMVHRASITLLGGRVYPLRLDFAKSNTGVDDSDKQKKRLPGAASVELDWRCPGQAVDAPIPSRCLIPAKSPEVFVLTTPFPPDDRSTGYERGDSVSKGWDDAATSAAIETADYVVAHLNDLAGSRDDSAKLRAFCRRFVERGLRRPLDPETKNRFVTREFETAPDNDTAIKRVVLRTLLSPRFLYREIGVTRTTGATDAPDPYAVASQLSFALWDSIPDKTLLQAAAEGNLATRDQVAAQAQRMAADPRAWNKEREFLHQWLKIDQYPDLAKDSSRFPDFTPTVADDLRTSLDLTLENIVRGDASDYRDLMLTDRLYLNGRLAKLYGVPAVAPDADFQPVMLDPGIRAGVLTHPYILSAFSYFATSDPIHRGVLLTRNILGRTLNPPPSAFAPIAASLHPDLTTRQRVALQTHPALCQSCHGIINPLGFTLERFDAIGRLRGVENGHTIDCTGSYTPRSGAPVHFGGARDLALFLANSDDAHAAFVQKLFQYTIKQPIRAYGPSALTDLQHTFAESGYNIRDLSAAIAVASTFPKASALPQKESQP